MIAVTVILLILSVVCLLVAAVLGGLAPGPTPSRWTAMTFLALGVLFYVLVALLGAIFGVVIR
jgi:hypothetical protein